MTILDSLYNELTRKAQIANKGITREIVEDWVGNAGNESHQIGMMSMIVNCKHKDIAQPGRHLKFVFY